MKDKKIKLLGMCLMACSVLGTGCGNKTEEAEAVAQQQTVNIEEVTNVSETLDAPTEEEQVQDNIANTYDFDFHGFQVNGQTPVWGNDPLNLKSTIPGLVCPGEDVTYYVNCGRDNYLYELKAGESRLLLSEVVTSLNIWDDELYFVLHEDGDIRGAGKVCKYNLQTGNLATVLDVEASYCCVGENGIYYTEVELFSYNGTYISTEYLKYYAFEDGSIMEYAGERWNQYGDYYALPLISENQRVGIGFQNINTDELLPVYPQSNEVFLGAGSICDNRYCGIGNNGDEFVWIDLQDGKSHKIVLPYSASYTWLYDYVKCNGEFYLSLGAGNAQMEQIALVDFENASMKKMTVWTEAERTYELDEIEQGNYEEIIPYSYQELYSDGKNLFVLKHFIDRENESLWDGLLLVQLVEKDGGFEEVELGANGNEE